jgi:arginine/lysine/ornithine decarboxylase
MTINTQSRLFKYKQETQAPARAFYAGYEESDREYIDLATARQLLDAGRTLVSITFVVPYPPGFPIPVPGQVISGEILQFIAQLDVEEIHGYRAELGFQVFTQVALDRLDAPPTREVTSTTDPANDSPHPATHQAHRPDKRRSR